MNVKDLIVGNFYVYEVRGICQYVKPEYINGDLYYLFHFKNKRKCYARAIDVEKKYYFYASSDKKVTLSCFDNKKSWQKKRDKSIEEIRQTAEKLVKLSIERKSLKGYKYNIDNMLEEFTNLLPFKLSEDQISTITEINNDLTSNQIANRMIYGGCGAGKTTILQYCLFVAYKNNFQGILLCPSTILAEQHYNGLKELFKDYDINIGLLTSKVTPKNKQKIYDDIASGNIDIVIGTTSICKKLQYKNLNTLLIDEPQKFGVAAKTYIKELQSNVNTFQATGTPLPRDFLEIEAGIMDISKIMTYPKDKKPIITNIIDNNTNNIKDIINFELQRKGKIYFVYNNVGELENTKNKLLNLIPELKICIIHGKINKKESTKIIEDFKEDKYNLMIATSIIETGVNINVNTIIIYEPDVWGLSSLHQVRNRVGRFGEQGYCYLVKSKSINPVAIKRLATICKYNQLGQDILIAEEDRKIRGSGNLFGEEQHGRVPCIGYTMYQELLSKELNKQLKEIS